MAIGQRTTLAYSLKLLLLCNNPTEFTHRGLELCVVVHTVIREGGSAHEAAHRETRACALHKHTHTAPQWHMLLTDNPLTVIIIQCPELSLAPQLPHLASVSLSLSRTLISLSIHPSHLIQCLLLTVAIKTLHTLEPIIKHFNCIWLSNVKHRWELIFLLTNCLDGPMFYIFGWPVCCCYKFTEQTHWYSSYIFD